MAEEFSENFGFGGEEEMGFGAFAEDLEPEAPVVSPLGPRAARPSVVSLDAKLTPFSPAAAVVLAVIPPAVADAPTDVVTERTEDAVTLYFTVPVDVSKLRIQALPTAAAAAAKKGSDPWANAAALIERDVPRPAEARSFVFSGLPANTEFLFRLLAENNIGKTAGKPSIAIGTLEACPNEGLFSGYVMLYPRPKNGASKGSTAQSMRRKPPTRVWAVLSPTAVRFYNRPITLGGKEDSYVNLKDTAFIAPIDDESGTLFTMACETLGSGVADAVMKVTTCRPTETTADVCTRWIAAISAAHDKLAKK